MAATSVHWSYVMKPDTPLKLSSIAFAILWTAWMVWWSDVFSVVNIGMLAVSGAVAAWLCFLACAGTSAASGCCRGVDACVRMQARPPKLHPPWPAAGYPLGDRRARWPNVDG